MNTLHPNWITQGLIDYEYKKYVLLAYLQNISGQFYEQKLYPFLSDLIFHYNNLVALKTQKQLAANSFPQKISKLDFENFKVKYEEMLKDDRYMSEIESILDFAIPLMKEQVSEGKELYDFVEDKIMLAPIGIVPLHTEAGYMLLKDGDERETLAYEYQITIFENRNERYRGIKTELVGSYYMSISTTFEKIKFDLIRRNRNLPNPATYAIESKLNFPLDETLLPIAKRMLVRHVSQSVA